MSDQDDTFPYYDVTTAPLSFLASPGSDQLFRILVDGVVDYAIYMLDTDGRVATWNSGAERIKGYKPDEILGAHFSRFYAEEDRFAGIPDRVRLQLEHA